MKTEQDLYKEILADASRTFDTLESDVLAFAEATADAVEAYNCERVGLDEMCFWYKSLVRAFLAQVEAQCSILRVLTATHAADLHAQVPASKLRNIGAIHRRATIEDNVKLAFRHFPALFGISTPFDASDENYRGFRALTKARARFTHPRTEQDICPLELFPSAKPAMEWFFLNWKSILLRCIAAANALSLDDRQLQIPSLYKDVALAPFRDVPNESRILPTDNEMIHVVRTVSLRLLADTSRAKRLIRGSTETEAVIGSCAVVRCLIRTMFSEIEGTLRMAESLLRRCRGEDGEVEESFLDGSHEDVRELMALTMEAFSREFGFGEPVDREGEAWEAFIHAREARDRLTHPKKPEDLNVRSEDLTTILRVESWWHRGDIEQCMKLNAARLPHRLPRPGKRRS